MAQRPKKTKSVREPDRAQAAVRTVLDAAVAEAFATTAAAQPACDLPVQNLSATPDALPAPTPARLPRPESFVPPASLSSAPLPARMMNEFVYCPRLFYYEHVEGVFVDNADTLRGQALHSRVDSGSGALPAARTPKPILPAEKPDMASDTGESKDSNRKSENETIHSRSVTLASDRLGVLAKMDLVEVRPATDEAIGDLFAQLDVCPVDYKAGSPREGEDGTVELWDADRMQLGLQCLILRDHGYLCSAGIIYYRGTKQRVRLTVTPELETWIVERIAAARATAHGPIPPPLVDSPKCPRCSLVTVCLPDETRLLANPASLESEPFSSSNPQALLSHRPSPSSTPRRLIAPRDEARVLYLNTPGLFVGRSGDVLQVKDKKTVVQEVRASDLSHVSLFGNIQISTQTIQNLCEQDIPLTYFSLGGWFYGITRGHSLKNVFLRIEQFRQAALPGSCLQLARQFIVGKIRNQRTMLMRNHVEAPESILLKLKNSAETALTAPTIESLLGVEGAAAAFYFQQFGGMIKAGAGPELDPSTDAIASTAPNSRETTGHPAPRFDFDFNGRNRRPPADPVNALLSLAYSLLAKDCTLAALSVGFDPYIGFYHQPRFGRPALALDVMEEFRPLIAESVVLTAINTGVLTSKDFVSAGRAVNLSAAGRRQFFQVYEQRMNHLVKHPVFNYQVSYRRALELQFRLLARVLTGEISTYIPFTTR